MEKQFKSVQEFSNLIEFDTVGQKVIGEYLGSYEYISKKTDKEGKQKSYTVHKIDLVSDNGSKQEAQIFGSGHLNSLLEKVSVGDLIMIEYKGKVEIDHPDYGKTESHSFDVLKAQ